jgi:hypothetical protein
MSSYRINSSGIWNIKQARDSKNNSEYPRDVYGEALIVAGGGSGGGGPSPAWQNGAGGGGGAGGLLYSCFVIIPGCQYNVAVGAGGTAPTGPTVGTSGNLSCFGSCLIACGGGRAADRLGQCAGPTPEYRLACAGGSGGGKSLPGFPTDTPAACCGIVGQGCPGGNPGPGGAGGGGGAGEAGCDGGCPVGGKGGNGLAYSISGASTFYAGGGGGGGTQGSVTGCGGLGGGGNGGCGSANPGPSIATSAGGANLGGGGGGAGSQCHQCPGCAGGSGVVFLRVPNLAPLPVGCSGVNSEYLCAGFKVYRWTGSGSITFN